MGVKNIVFIERIESDATILIFSRYFCYIRCRGSENLTHKVLSVS